MNSRACKFRDRTKGRSNGQRWVRSTAPDANEAIQGGTRRRNSARLHPQTYIPAFQKRQTSLVSGQRAAQKSELHAPLTGMPNLRAWGLDVKADP